MSTIMRALRRLEEENEEQAAQDRLHGEVVAPQPTASERTTRPIWHWVALGVVGLLVAGGSVYGVTTWLSPSGGADAIRRISLSLAIAWVGWRIIPRMNLNLVGRITSCRWQQP